MSEPRIESSGDFALRAAELFADAVERAPRAADRAAFLENACSDDLALRAEVESLLTAHDHTAGFLQPLDPALLAELMDGFEHGAEGERLGAYRVLREIGRGGMGVVYLAERADGQFEQRVALKLVRNGLDSRTVLERFLHERRILARLQHPNIARLLDGGVTEDGRPFLVMEYVEGKPITDYCDQERLTIDARLRLFAEACSAVQYAHRNLVIHRDLKPANILVTSEGHAMLLDFGIARLLDPGTDGRAASPTEAGLRAMTPDYAAPEQVLGEPVTTATDVYGLGAILYELLTGQRAHVFRRRTLEAIARVLREETPLPPSTRVEHVRAAGFEGWSSNRSAELIASVRSTTPDRLHRRLRGDLDAIALKALRAEAERRYTTAEALHDDLRRHLGGAPVAARRDTFAYQSSRFVRRNRALSLAAGLALVSLICGLAATTWQARRANRERTIALREADRAGAVANLMSQIFQLAHPNRALGEELTVRTALDSGRTWIDRELANQPELHAETAKQLADVYYGLGHYAQSRELLESAVTKFIAARGEVDQRVNTALLMLARVLIDLGENDSAEVVARRSLTIMRRIPSLKDDRFHATHALAQLGNALRRQERFDDAERVLHNALAILPRDHPDAPHRRTVILTTLGHILRARGDPAGAEKQYREVLETRRHVWGPEHPEVANAVVNLAGAIGDQGRFSEAETLYHDGLDMRRRIQGEAHPDFAMDLGALAGVLQRRGDPHGAVPLFERAVALQGQALPALSPHRVMTLTGLGETLLELGRPREAEPVLREAVRAASETHGPNHGRTAAAQSALGAALLQLGSYNEAGALLVAAHRALAATLGSDARATRIARARLDTLEMWRRSP